MDHCYQCTLFRKYSGNQLVGPGIMMGVEDIPITVPLI